MSEQSEHTVAGWAGASKRWPMKAFGIFYLFVGCRTFSSNLDDFRSLTNQPNDLKGRVHLFTEVTKLFKKSLQRQGLWLLIFRTFHLLHLLSTLIVYQVHRFNTRLRLRRPWQYHCTHWSDVVGAGARGRLHWSPSQPLSGAGMRPSASVTLCRVPGSHGAALLSSPATLPSYYQPSTHCLKFYNHREGPH